MKQIVNWQRAAYVWHIFAIEAIEEGRLSDARTAQDAGAFAAAMAREALLTLIARGWC